MGTLGETLHNAREKKGASLADAVEGTHILPRYIEALEAGDFTCLPAPVYVRGFLRSYCDFLGLDIEETTRLYHEEASAMEQSAPSSSLVARDPIVQPRVIRRMTLGWLAGLAALAAVVILVIARPPLPDLSTLLPGNAPAPTPTSTPTADTVSGIDAAPASPVDQPATPDDTPVTQPPATSAVALPTDTAVPSVQIEVAVIQRSWISVTVDGAQVFSANLEPGDVRTWTGKSVVAMRAGNAGGTLVTVNGVFRGPLGAPGAVVDVSFPVAGASGLPAAAQTPSVVAPTDTVSGTPAAVTPTGVISATPTPRP